MATYSAPAVTPRAGPTGGSNKTVMSIVGNGAGGTAAAASVLRFGPFPAGTRIDDVVLWPSAATTSLTVQAGYTPTDGSVGDDDAFIAASTALATAAARVRANTAGSPVTLLKESYIDITTAGATIAADTVVNCVVDHTWIGTT